MSEFASSTIGFGIVVRDIDKAVAFYRDALGMTEVEGFDVPAAMGGDSGLSDNKAFCVRIMQLMDEPGATNVKLMQFTNANAKPIDNRFIHSSLGIRYLTILVKDMDAAVARAKKAGVEPMAKGPIALPEGLSAGVYLACVRDPDGNIIELLGPRGGT